MADGVQGRAIDGTCQNLSHDVRFKFLIFFQFGSHVMPMLRRNIAAPNHAINWCLLASFLNLSSLLNHGSNSSQDECGP
ncbi:hypothetical protein Fraau_1488 [Frateuria aurantia DSM 6220]|uniref:Uncharacterized protein n=1 Tax=Frateuria aurantia (strain ATCC 33424 / DSM 6220 / KCTC 2777 / LMG 1558 / NBRC 3245 / NCIMB 13370) TaxID=767434 RepID=H8L665_FRAAD|nr:hypothetical protein Fraau_1488 [Frateuria aurantia DSM 6220]